MSKATITRIFIGALLALAVGIVVATVTVVAAILDGVVTIGGPSVVTVDGAVFAGSLPWLLIAMLLSAGGSVAVLASWVAALFNTVRLDDKTWFAALLVLGLFSFGWVAMIAYIVAGPDGSTQAGDRSAATGVA